MPLNISPKDRWLLFGGSALMVLMLIALAVASPQEEESEIPSSYSADSHGSKGAYLLLKERGYKVERWESSPLMLPKNTEHTVLILAVPTSAPSLPEKNSLRRFLSSGGRIVAIGLSCAAFLDQADLDPEFMPGPEWKDFQPQVVSALTRGGAIRMAPVGYWRQSSTGYLVHYSQEKRPLVVSYRVGKGEVIWWGGVTPITNAGISSAGNLALFLNSVANNRENHILWDEYFHGHRDTLGSYLALPPFKYGLLQCGLLAFVVLLSFSRRNSPIYPSDDTVRLSPLEFVHTLGGLYHRAKATHAALEVPYAAFRGAATRRLGLKPDTPSDQLAAALRKRLRYEEEGLEEVLANIDSALQHGEPKEDRVLDLLQKLNHHMKNLDLARSHE